MGLHTDCLRHAIPHAPQFSSDHKTIIFTSIRVTYEYILLNYATPTPHSDFPVHNPCTFPLLQAGDRALSFPLTITLCLRSPPLLFARYRE